MKQYFLLLLMLIQGVLSAQNLIKNPGFEDSECGKPTGKGGGIYVKNKKGESCKIKEWDNPTQGRVELTLNDTSNIPRTGNYCLGINAFGFGTRSVREYIMGNLSRPLTEGKTYIFKMNLKLSKRSTHVVTNLGAYFSADRVNMTTTAALPFKPQVANKGTIKEYILSSPGVKSPKDLVTWTGDNTLTIEGSFVAYGGEKYVVIGNFDNDKTTVSSPILNYGGAKPQKTYAYYLIDDVSLEEDASMPLTLVKKPLFQKKDLKIGNVLSLKDVVFDQNSSMISSKAAETLVKLADLLTDNPRMELEVEGHNDVTGKEPAKLSEDRAQAVIRFLLLNGVDRKRLTYKGCGTDKPISFYFTPKEQAKNRRVECKIVKM